MLSDLRAAVALFWICVSVFVVVPAAQALPRTDTLDAVRQRGHVVCGVQEEGGGFARLDSTGQWTGLEVDACQAVAAAVLGRKEAVAYRLVPPAERHRALKAGEIDLLTAQSSWTLTRDSALGLRFAAPLLYDGPAMMVRRRQGVASMLEMSGASVCVLDNAGNVQNVRDYFATRRMRIRSLVTTDAWKTLLESYLASQCTAISGDATTLARARAGLKVPDDHVVLPERLALEPVGIYVREGSERWFTVVRWTILALIAAEEANITGASVDTIVPGEVASLAARRLLGFEAHLGHELGLARDWTRTVIRSVGNYGEMYDRNFGERSFSRLERGYNNLWSKGGVMVAPPFR